MNSKQYLMINWSYDWLQEYVSKCFSPYSSFQADSLVRKSQATTFEPVTLANLLSTTMTTTATANMFEVISEKDGEKCSHTHTRMCSRQEISLEVWIKVISWQWHTPVRNYFIPQMAWPSYMNAYVCEHVNLRNDADTRRIGRTFRICVSLCIYAHAHSDKLQKTEKWLIDIILTLFWSHTHAYARGWSFKNEMAQSWTTIANGEKRTKKFQAADKHMAQHNNEIILTCQKLLLILPTERY